MSNIIAMKRCSISYVTRELKIKTTRYHYTPIRLAKIQTSTTPNDEENVEQQGFSFIVGGNAKWFRNFARQFGSFIQSLT